MGSAEPSEGNVDLVLHVEGPEAEGVVVVTDEAVLSLVLGQKMTIETAMVTGLLALDGTPDGVA